MILLLFSLAIAYLPKNFDISSVKNLFLPVPSSPIMINAVYVLDSGFCSKYDIQFRMNSYNSYLELHMILNTRSKKGLMI
jgi:hypothetical protein